MKKIIAITLTFIMLLSIVSPVYASIHRFSDSDRERFNVEEYHEVIWHNFNALFDYTPWQFILQDELFAFRGFVQKLNDVGWFMEMLLSFTKWVTDESPDVERYIEILVNFMMLMQYDLDEVHNHMAEADALKGFWDYFFDVAGIGMSIANINSEKLERIKNTVRVVGLAYRTAEVIRECISSYRLLSKMLLDFETQFYFLTAIIQHADNNNLVEAARALRNNIERTMEYKMNFFIENSYRIAEYLFQDVLIDIIIMDMINNPEHLKQLGLNDTEIFGMGMLAKGYTALGKVIAGYNIVRYGGVFIADMVAGISNIMNRVVEAQAMYQINRALIVSTENLRRNVSSVNDKDTIERIVSNMRSIMIVNARGEYIVYQMAMYDGQLLSLLMIDRDNMREWYTQVQDIFTLLTNPLEWFFPDIEIFLLDYNEVDINYNENNVVGGAVGGVNLATYELQREIREAYYEFLRQRAFEPYIERGEMGQWWTYSFTEYAIIDINGDGIPELIVNSTDDFGWSLALVFTYDIDQREITYVSEFYRFVSLNYSEKHRSLVFSPSRGPSFVVFSTLDDLENGWSFSFFFDIDSESFVKSYGGFEYIRENRNISNEEHQSYFDGVVAVVFSDIPISEQVSVNIPSTNNNLSFNSMISAGAYHTVVLREDGTVWALGSNGRGQLGDGTTTWRSMPVQVQNLNNVIAISAGRTHTVALKSNGTVWAWGANNDGQLGDGTTNQSNTPIQVAGLNDITAISAGGSHSLALKADGTVWAWGSNFYGQLGNGSATWRITPLVQIEELNDIITVSAGATHSVALGANGTVWAWGSNSYGALGDGTITRRHTPVQAQNLNNVIAISAGSSYTVALREDGTVWTWGRNSHGQLGDGTTTWRSMPLQVQGLNNIMTISAGIIHTKAVAEDGIVWAWGVNWYGHLGDGTTIGRNTPIQVQYINNVIAISAGRTHTVALTEDSYVWAWGRGGGITVNQYTPVQVIGENGIEYFNIGAN